MRNLSVWHEAQVIGIQNITPTVREIHLQPAAMESAQPGSHINVKVMIDDRPDHRSYSVVRQLDNGGLVIAVKQLPDSRGGSRYMWTLEPGARVSVTPAACDFELSYGAPEYLLIAGGIGITPIFAMARALASRGEKVRMLYAARSREELAYAEELRALLDDSVQLFTDADGTHMDIAAEIENLHPKGELYICGPLGLMEAVRGQWRAQGREPAGLHYETFGSSGRHPSGPFTVKVPRLGLEVNVPKDRSILDVLTEAGVEVLSDCRRGECGLCAMDVTSINGEIDHRDVFFSEEQHSENKQLCTCVSRLVSGSIAVDPAWKGDPELRK
ncbi:PDR/VanB family oxidoreductase [Marinobacterium lutimaris]|uniref:Vanillate demethylase subunit B n=1 Tax=Marinobacterium lutimaris TaxID=568106 RepID=A0A1H6CRT0_9GAMM|nr:PDR/VanB family oxidoreductase [Marinobacterium lutimaris]SEG75096.1 vanillate demethylase subunit B [Marinobacterium lutimaris]